MVQTFHQNGLRVIMDVVYNHTRLTEDSYFNQLVPGYYYRQTKDGSFPMLLLVAMKQPVKDI
jgi:pullulanase